jgi:hypothetical protein
MNDSSLIDRIKMDSRDTRIATIQWDTLMDLIETICRHHKCICCRGIGYRTLVDVWDVPQSAPEFDSVEKAYLNLIDVIDEIPEIDIHLLMRHHKHNHQLDKAFIRELMDAEIKLMVALHYHPRLCNVHICFINYAMATHFGVETFAYGDDIALKDAMHYVSVVDDVRNLFE